MSTLQIPSSSRATLEGIVTAKAIPMAELEQAYEAAYFSEYVQSSGYFQTDDAKHSYAAMAVQADYLLKQRQTLHKIIPIGSEGWSLSKKSGDKQGTMYVVEQTSKGQELRRTTIQGDDYDIFERLQPFVMYDVMCGQFDDGGLILDNRSKFENPVDLGVVPKEFMKMLAGQFNWKVVTIAGSKTAPSKLVQSGTRQFVDNKDWRIIQGFVVDFKTGKQKDGTTEWGNYTIADQTVSGAPMVLPDGRTIYPGMTIWLHPSMIKWAKKSVLKFYGTIELDRDKEGRVKTPVVSSMKCKQILPIYPVELAPPENA